MVRNIGVNFNGRRIVHPGAYTKIDGSALSSLGSVGTRKVAILGSSEGGEPGKVLTFSNPSDAAKVLRGGDLLEAARLAWSPSGDENGAGDIAFIRVEDATKASLTKDNMTITSLDWGAHTSQIQVKLEDGTQPNSKMLEVYHAADGIRETYDNIGPIFTVVYEGTGTIAELSVTENASNDKILAINVDGEDVMSYTLGQGDYQDINKVVYDINEHVDFTASMVSFGNKNINAEDLDEVAAQDVTSEYTVTALKGDTLYQTQFSQLVSISFSDTGTYPTNFTFENLQGGTEGTIPPSWANLLELLYGEGVKLIAPLSGDEAIHHEVQRFVLNQSNEERMPMIGFYGGRSGETVDDVIKRAFTINSSRGVVAYPGITVAESNGQTKHLEPHFFAAMVAGIVSGKETGDPITLDSLSLIGVEKVLKSSEVDRLITAGVTVAEFVRHPSRHGYRIAQGITTYQQDSNPSYREISMVLVSDELNTELNAYLEDRFVGGRGTQSSIALIKNETQSFLDRKKRDEVIVDYDPQSVEVVLEGDVVYVNYAVIPVGSINYILNTAKYYQQQIRA